MPESTPALAAETNPAHPPAATGGIGRTARLLRLIALHNATGLRLVDVAAESGLERPTAHRVLQALVQSGLVGKDPTTRRYYIGPTAFEITGIAAPAFNLADLSRTAMRTIAAQCGDNVHLTTWRGLDIQLIERVPGRFPVQVQHLPIGARAPLGSSSGGIAMLAALPEDEAAGIVQANAARYRASRANLSADEVHERIRQCRVQGSAFNQRAMAEGAIAIAVAIKNRAARPVGALTIVGITDRMSIARQHELLTLLLAGARQIGDELHRVTRT